MASGLRIGYEDDSGKMKVDFHRLLADETLDACIAALPDGNVSRRLAASCHGCGLGGSLADASG